MSDLSHLHEKAGDGTTDYLVEIRQSDLAALLARIDDPCAQAGRHVCGPADSVSELRRVLEGDDVAIAALDRLVAAGVSGAD